MSPLLVPTTCPEERDDLRLRAQRIPCFVCLNNIAQYQEKSGVVEGETHGDSSALRDRLRNEFKPPCLIKHQEISIFVFFLLGLFNDRLCKGWFLCVQRGKTNLFVFVQKAMGWKKV